MMKMTLATLLVMKDTLHGSLCINSDRLGLFSYDEATRKRVAQEMDKWVNSVIVDVEIDNEDD